MCGIFGAVVREGDVTPAILDGLALLEYRGYDSAGIAVFTSRGMERRRRVGKLEILRNALAKEGFGGPATIGVGHTRWATHGGVTEANAHPHSDSKDELVLVHNGIIENYLDLRGDLITKGHQFLSSTDSEVLAHAIEDRLQTIERGGARQHPDISALEEAVMSAARAARGTYAIVVLHKRYPDRIIVARQDSPVVIGIGRGAAFVASDVPALLRHTRSVYYLRDGEVATLTTEGVGVRTLDGKVVSYRPQEIAWDAAATDRRGYPHYMLKEIEEQPDAIAQTAFDRLDDENGDVRFEDFDVSDEKLKSAQRIQIIACGTSLHAGFVGKFLIEEFAGLPVECDYASEFRYRTPLPSKDVIAIGISQSGETMDTLKGLGQARERGAAILDICNVKGSSIPRMSDATIYTHAGPEIGVASTKAFTCQLVALYLLAIRMGRARGRLSRDDGRELLLSLRKLRPRLDALFNDAARESVRALAKKYQGSRDFLFLGRGLNYPIALEGALKLKEISYIHAEGYPAGEMKHGPIAMIDATLPVVVIATRGRDRDKTLNQLEQVRARGGRVIVICNAGDADARRLGDDLIEVPATSDHLAPIVNVIPLQRLAYEIAVCRNLSPDNPRNLAKSVTVE
ncbi:MAG: glutamine--fructose-6-phosphate transaminase (isomerizing) [Planctomycetes bacterium]|nr:glutamine--fructose-6-phosphate transaminase (isomerizing) [Planctomycetota bacterium]